MTMQPSTLQANSMLRPVPSLIPTPKSPMVLGGPRSRTTFTRLTQDAQGSVAVKEEEGVGIMKALLAPSSSPTSNFLSPNAMYDENQPTDLDTVYCDYDPSLWEVSSSSSSSFSTLSSGSSAGRTEELNVGIIAIQVPYLTSQAAQQMTKHRLLSSPSFSEPVYNPSCRGIVLPPRNQGSTHSIEYGLTKPRLIMPARDYDRDANGLPAVEFEEIRPTQHSMKSRSAKRPTISRMPSPNTLHIERPTTPRMSSPNTLHTEALSDLETLQTKFGAVSDWLSSSIDQTLGVKKKWTGREFTF